MSKKVEPIEFINENREIRVCGNLFKPIKVDVKNKDIREAQKELEKMAKEQERTQAKIDKIKQIMELESTSLEDYDKLEKKLEEEEAKVDEEEILLKSASIVTPFFEDLTEEEYVENSTILDNSTVAVHIVAVQGIIAGKSNKEINSYYYRAIDSGIETYMDNITNPNS